MKKTTLLLGSIAICAGFAQAPAYADPPPWAPAHGYRAKHNYVYYPAREVYYAPETRTWFWLSSGGGWHVGASLPHAYVPYTRTGGVPIVLETAHPYERHTYVVEHYGKHKHKKHKHKHKKHKHKHDHDD